MPWYTVLVQLSLSMLATLGYKSDGMSLTELDLAINAAICALVPGFGNLSVIDEAVADVEPARRTSATTAEVAHFALRACTTNPPQRTLTSRQPLSQILEMTHGIPEAGKATGTSQFPD